MLPSALMQRAGPVRGEGFLARALVGLGILAIIARSASENCQLASSEGMCANPKRLTSSSVPAVYGGSCASGAAFLASGESCQQVCPDGMSRGFGQAATLTCHSGISSALPLECSPRK